ncbi:MAG: hypothetical protein JNL01_12850 [Bdellovibrionales bacterium]|nr:hypothetical protein [Bdellovibrionales bacterium]
MKTSSTVWLKRLRLGCLFVLLTGLLPSFAVFQITQEPWRFFFDLLAWPLDQNPATFTDHERQISAVLGGVLCGWAILLYRLAQPEVFNQKLRVLMIQSVWVWFAIDSLGSIFAGIPLNAVSNISFLLMLLVPLHQLKSA